MGKVYSVEISIFSDREVGKVTVSKSCTLDLIETNAQQQQKWRNEDGTFTKEGILAISKGLIEGLMVNIRSAESEGLIKDHKHMEYVRNQLDTMFTDATPDEISTHYRNPLAEMDTNFESLQNLVEESYSKGFRYAVYIIHKEVFQNNGKSIAGKLEFIQNLALEVNLPNGIKKTVKRYTDHISKLLTKHLL